MTLTLEQMKKNRRLWVEALRSGKYKQGTGRLRSADNKYCCLGVLSTIAKCKWMKHKSSYSVGSEYHNATDKARNFVGLRGIGGEFFNGEALWDLNDSGTTFSEIADIIESEPEGLFVDAPLLTE
jgi:hypothetical protein